MLRPQKFIQAFKVLTIPTVKCSAHAYHARFSAYIDIGQPPFIAVDCSAFYLHITLTLLANTQATVCGNEDVVAMDLAQETLFIINLLV